MMDKKEILFWKVFHNQFLLSYIINKIQTTEWVEYTDPNQIDSCNRWKFKDIQSFDWLIKNKQISLLIEKIKHNEYIFVDQESIQQFFKLFSIEKEEKEEKEEKINYEEILKLLLDKKRNEFEICDLTTEAIECNSIGALRILINEPYNMVVYPSSLQLAIKNCHPLIVKELISSIPSLVITDEIKLESFKMAASNFTYSIEMIEFILDNPILYSLPKPTSNLPELSNKRFKSSNDIEMKEDGEEEKMDQQQVLEEKKEDHLLLISDLLQIRDDHLDTLNRLMELDVISNRETTIQIEHFLNFEKNSIEQLEILLKFYYKYLNSVPPFNQIPKKVEKKISRIKNKYKNNPLIKLKKIQKLVIIQVKPIKFYRSYICKYGESIDEYTNDGFYSKYGNQQLNKNELGFLAFFRLLMLSGVNSTEIYSKSYLKKSISLIKKENLQMYPNFFNFIESQIHGESIDIHDYSIIEWFSSFKSPLLTNPIQNNQLILNFEMNEEISKSDYGVLKIKDHQDKPLIQDFKNMYDFFGKSYNDAIERCVLPVLKFIDSLDVIVYIPSNLKLPTSKDKLIELINYFNESGFKAFNTTSFHHFFEKVFEILPPSSIVCKLPFEFGLGREIVFQSFGSSCSLNFSEFLLNNLDLLFISQDDLYSYHSLNLFDFSEGTCIYQNTYISTQLVSIIRIIIHKFNNDRNDRLSVCSIINIFFKLLIQSKGVDREELQKLFKLFNNHSIKIEHSLFHSFYYLQIRSAKFTKYILSRPNLKWDTSINNIYNTDKNPTEFSLVHHLDIEVFNFDYIFGRCGISRNYNNSFDTILLELTNQLSNGMYEKNIEIKEDYYYEIMNSNLLYYLDIKRVDLFFKQLKFISKQTDDALNSLDGYESRIDLLKNQQHTYLSPALSLLPTSLLFKNRQLPTMPPTLCIWKEDLKMPVVSTVYGFPFSDEVLSLSCSVMNVSECQQFLEYNFYIKDFHSDLFKQALSNSNFDILKHILDNYKIDFYSPVVRDFESGHFDADFMFKNYFKKVEYPSRFESKINEYNDQLFKIHFLDDLLTHLSLSINEEKYHRFISTETRNQVLEELIIELHGKFEGTLLKDEEQEEQEEQNQEEEQEEEQNHEQEQEEEQLKNNEEDEQIVEVENEESYAVDGRADHIQSILEQDGTQLFLLDSIDQFISFNNSKREKEYTKLLSEYSENYGNMFLQSFIVGNVTLCDLILKYYPNQFKITKSAISYALQNKNIHIIKYYSNNKNPNLIDNGIIKNDKDLMNHLKDELLKHNDYKHYLNWLK